MTAATVEAGGVELAYEEHGEGQPVAFVHGTAVNRAIWRETIDALPPGFRTIAYDRRAYGGSGAPEPYGGTTIGEQADDLAELIERLDAAPAVLCGHELGALAVLDLAARRADLVASVVVTEPPLLWLVPSGTDTVADMREAVAEGARKGGAAGAVLGYLEEVGGEQARELLGDERVDAALAAPRAFAADLAAAASWTGGRSELRAIGAPLLIIIGLRSSPTRREAARALDELLPASRAVEVDSGHFVPVEQPQAVAAAISGRGV